MDGDNWPTYAAELTRKGALTLAKWSDRRAAGKITDRDLYIVIDTLWDTMSGLCEAEFLRTLEELMKELRDGTK